MFEIFTSGPSTLAGTLLGLALAYAVHKFVPLDATAMYVEAGVVALGFGVGLLCDGAAFSPVRRSRWRDDV